MPGCSQCVHCVDSPDGLERELPGLAILSSAYGSVRGDTSLCRFHNQFIRPGAACSGFEDWGHGVPNSPQRKFWGLSSH